jgi:DNA-binding transcriptional MerR regulator
LLDAVKSANLRGREMRDLRLTEAAAVLHVSPDTLRSWERRFGYPHPVTSGTGQQRYVRGEVFTLRDSLRTGLSVASAIEKARVLGTEHPDP